MKVKLLKYWDQMRSSFWFLPALMTAATVALAAFSIALDERWREGLPQALSWAYAGSAEGATAVLSTIAGSMITIAGVVFSLTLVALSLASSQFGPRLLRNFMRDTTNQVVIGTFISTFMYCLLVLRTIRHEDASFVPQFSVTLGVAFALVSLAVLIYFIHHVAISIQADEVIARVTEELLNGVESMFPEQLGDAVQPFDLQTNATPADFDAAAAPICATDDGYIQFTDADELMSIATAEDLLLRIERRPGHYVVAGAPLVLVYPQQNASETVRKALRDAFVIGETRTAAQDVEFSLSQLVEIAVRALSPGVNDPFTAIRCIDRLGSAMCRLAQRQTPSPWRRDEQNALRVVAQVMTFRELLDAGFDQIRQSARSNVAVTIRLLDTIATIAPFTHRSEDRAALQRQADMIAHAARNEPCEDNDRNDIDARYALAGEALARGVKQLQRREAPEIMLSKRT